MSPDPPKMLSTLHGREAELAALGDLLTGSGVITLTGPPGVGKTRLARELAARWDGRPSFVDLARITNSDLVPHAIAFALGIPELPGRGPLAAVVAHLREQPTLLVLDNCEHLLSGCREVVEQLRAGCSRLLVLATSRQPLGLEDERVSALAPLAVPDRGGAETPEALLAYPAVGLFVERAARADSGFVLNSYVAPSVAEICRRLDGIPLAIELAAARVDMLTPAEIAGRLDARFDLLTRGEPGELARHRTLEAALDWSHDLLEDREAALLRRLSVFVGGFDREAAAAVCAGERLQAGAVSEVLGALVSKSLVVAVADAGRARLRLLETIRAYATDRLERSDEAALLRERHARFYVALAESLEPSLTGAGQAAALARVELEHENLRRALEWSLGHGHGEWALRLSGSLVLFWRVRCRFSEGRELLEAALAADGRGAPAERAKALWGAGFLALMAGDPRGAAPSLDRSVSLYRKQGDARGTARALLILGNCNQALGSDGVLPLLDESAALARRAGDPWCLAHALALAGLDHAHRGEYPAARAVTEESLAVAREGHDDQGLRIALIALGWVAVDQGAYAEAEKVLDAALAISDELDEDYSRATALWHLARLALGRGAYDRARALVEQAFELTPEVAPPNVALDLYLLQGRVAHAAGDRDVAHRSYQQAAAAAGRATPPLSLLWSADLRIDEGKPEEGRRLLDDALAGARASGNTALAAQALRGLGRVAQDAGDARAAAMLNVEAIEIQHRIGAAPSVVESIEALALIDPAAGGYEHSARLLGAAAALRREGGYARHAWELTRYDLGAALVREGLADGALRKAFAQGERLAIDAAVGEAVQRAGRRGRPYDGWASLTPAERRAATLVAEGLSNRAIAERLCISLGTVKSHLSHSYAKLGVAGRGELAVRVWRHLEGVPAPGGLAGEGRPELVAGARNGRTP